MFVILVYDFGEKRVGRALKIARKYLHWVQNSVFEGEITQANLLKLKKEMEQIMDPDEDSIILYTFRTLKYSERQTMGVKKGGDDLVI